VFIVYTAMTDGRRIQTVDVDPLCVLSLSLSDKWQSTVIETYEHNDIFITYYNNNKKRNSRRDWVARDRGTVRLAPARHCLLRQSVCLPVSLSVCLSVCMSGCVYISVELSLGGRDVTLKWNRSVRLAGLNAAATQ